jgi:hypothetical protein
MYSRLGLSVAIVFLAGVGSSAFSQTQPSYSVQVASFPTTGEAARYAARLTLQGEHPMLYTVDLPARGQWTRVIIGGFPSTKAARQQGARLVQRGVIESFLVAPNYDELASSGKLFDFRHVPLEKLSIKPSTESIGKSSSAITKTTPHSRLATQLPAVPSRSWMVLPAAMNYSMAPRPQPVRVAIRFIFGSDPSSSNGGLWLSGDRENGARRLRWIAGSRDQELIRLSDGGRVEIDYDKMLRFAGVDDSNRPDAALALADYITSNEGLLLLVQISEAANRYCLHIGQRAPTQAGLIPIRAAINLDTRFDSRINPHRRKGKKLECELPPPGFDSLVAINPDARWLNLGANELVPPGHITFHELAEAFAKLEMGLDYLATPTSPGAHDVAIERERSLKSERPTVDVVVTIGPNRVLDANSSEDQRLGTASALAGGKRR